MSYLNGVAYTVKTDNKEEFKAFAQEMCALFVEYGALHAVDAWGVDVPEGELTSFPIAVKQQQDETVCFSFIAWPSKAASDKAWEAIMQDDRMKSSNMTLMDGKRMIHGGFEVIAEARA